MPEDGAKVLGRVSRVSGLCCGSSDQRDERLREVTGSEYMILYMAVDE